MRHGETDFNADTDKGNRITNPKYPDCRLNQNGISQAKAFIYNGNIYINTDNATIDSPIHEMLHIVIGGLSRSNP